MIKYNTNKLANQRQSIFSLIRRLWNHIEKKRQKQFKFLFVIMFFASFSEVLSIGAVLPFLGVLTNPEKVFNLKILHNVFYYFNIEKPSQILLPFTIIFSLAVLFSAFFRMLLLWAQTKIGHNIGTDFSLSVYKKTLYQPYSIHVQRNSSEVISGISNKVQSIIYSILLPILNLISSFIMIFTILCALFFINSKIAVYSILGFSIIYSTIIKLSKKRIAIDSKKISNETTFVIKALQEGLGGIRDVLIDGTQNIYCDIYKKSELPLRRAQARVLIISGFPRFAIEALGMILIAILAYSLSRSVDGVTKAIPTLGALALGAQRMLPVLQQSYASWISIKGSESTLIDTLNLLDQPMPHYTEYENKSKLLFNRNIFLNNICFKYTPNSNLVLSNISIDIPKGSKIGFIGTTGTGKSTLLDIIMGLLEPTSGRIEIDGVTVDINNCRAWQSNIAHVPQSIYLADTTILENIAFGVPYTEIDLERVYKAARMSKIDQTINLLENKYLTNVGERGVRLSGGQRQRIGIARALYKQADVIVFDEATSALDNETEQEVL
jgi:ABC-type multidrug transport system fused ATPase/permease subunit